MVKAKLLQTQVIRTVSSDKTKDVLQCSYKVVECFASKLETPNSFIEHVRSGSLEAVCNFFREPFVCHRGSYKDVCGKDNGAQAHVYFLKYLTKIVQRIAIKQEVARRLVKSHFFEFPAVGDWVRVMDDRFWRDCHNHSIDSGLIVQFYDAVQKHGWNFFFVRERQSATIFSE